LFRGEQPNETAIMATSGGINTVGCGCGHDNGLADRWFREVLVRAGALIRGTDEIDALSRS